MVSTVVVDYHHGFFDESPDYDSSDYAETEAPASDDELLSDDDDDASLPGGELATSIQDDSTEQVVSASQVSCSARANPPHYTRRIVEFCCGSESRIGALAPPDCEVIRLTIDDDLTTEAGLEKAIAAVSQPDIPVLLFG